MSYVCAKHVPLTHNRDPSRIHRGLRWGKHCSQSLCENSNSFISLCLRQCQRRNKPNGLKHWRGEQQHPYTRNNATRTQCEKQQCENNKKNNWFGSKTNTIGSPRKRDLKTMKQKFGSKAVKKFLTAIHGSSFVVCAVGSLCAHRYQYMRWQLCWHIPFGWGQNHRIPHQSSTPIRGYPWRDNCWRRLNHARPRVHNFPSVQHSLLDSPAQIHRALHTLQHTPRRFQRTFLPWSPEACVPADGLRLQIWMYIVTSTCDSIGATWCLSGWGTLQHRMQLMFR